MYCTMPYMPYDALTVQSCTWLCSYKTEIRIHNTTTTLLTKSPALVRFVGLSIC
jgi:hypothetical protein